MRRLPQVPWRLHHLQARRELNVHVVSAWYWLLVLAGMWTPSLYADNAAPGRHVECPAFVAGLRIQSFERPADPIFAPDKPISTLPATTVGAIVIE